MKILFNFFLLIAITFNANAANRIDITKGNMEPMPVAVTDFVVDRVDEKLFAEDMRNIITNDLERSGLFKLIRQDAFIQKINSSSSMPHFPSWRQINANVVSTGGISFVGNDTIAVTFRLWDIYTEKQIAGRQYTASRKDWRQVAHVIADEIYMRLTGEDGYFNTRIVYVAEQGTANNRIKRLAMMDQDGANVLYLTDGKHLVLTPRFSPNTQKIIYMSYVDQVPHVYIRDVLTGVEKLVGKFPGMTFAPRFSPSGNKVIMSVAINGNTDLFEINLITMSKKRLTQDRGIDTSPTYSPDEKYIAFNSDRGGTQQLYVMRSNGSEVRRISFGEGRYATPVWSPRGDLIAFTKLYNKKFYIGVMRPDGSGERLLTESYLDEGPTWSPNGRVLMFTRQNKRKNAQDSKFSNIYSIDLTGYNERKIETPTDSSDPAWSPQLPLLH